MTHSLIVLGVIAGATVPQMPSFDGPFRPYLVLRVLLALGWIVLGVWVVRLCGRLKRLGGLPPGPGSRGRE